MSDAIVTGCAGFLGSHLSEALIGRGDRVTGIDSFDPFYDAAQKRRNLSALSQQPRFRFVEGDLRTAKLPSLLDRETVVYHLAAQPGVRTSWGAFFPRYVENNILATHAVLEALAGAGHRAPIVYASSSSVYGEGVGGATPESAPTHPISPYGMTKLAAEQLVHLYGRERGLATVALRFFSVYGPRQRPDMAFHRFFDAVAADRPIEVFGDGQQLRDFTYVGDVVEGILGAAEAIDATRGQTFNLGRGGPERLDRAIAALGRVVGHAPKTLQCTRQAGDPMTTWADIAAAQSAFGFHPRTPIDKGLERQWAWHERERAELAT